MSEHEQRTSGSDHDHPDAGEHEVHSSGGPIRFGEWSPATAKAGENFTIEGRIRAVGVGMRNLTNDEPRYVAYRRSMMRTGVRVSLAAGALVAIVALIASSIHG